MCGSIRSPGRPACFSSLTGRAGSRVRLGRSPRVKCGTCDPPRIVHRSTWVFWRQPPYAVTVVSAPSTSVTRSSVGERVHPYRDAAVEGNPRLDRGLGRWVRVAAEYPPPLRMRLSASPRMFSTLTGFDGLHLDTSLSIAPLSTAIAAIRSACSHAIRNDMNAPFEWPARYTRAGSTEYRAETAAITSVR